MFAHCVDDAFPVDVRRIVKAGSGSGVVRQGSNSIDYVLDLARNRLGVRWYSGGAPFAHVVELTSTTPYLGGLRWWAKCPRCARRCAVLRVLGAGTFGCRVCLKLTYASTRESSCDLAWRRVRRVRARLSASPNISRPLIKPKGMHWRTFFALAEEERLAMLDVLDDLHRLSERVDRLVDAAARGSRPPIDRV